jgi:hypothetical protein
MSYTLRCKGVLQRADNMLLPHNFGKKLRPPTAVKSSVWLILRTLD